MQPSDPLPVDLIPPPLPQTLVDRVEQQVDTMNRQAAAAGRPLDVGRLREELLRGARRAHAQQHVDSFVRRMGPPARRA